MASTGFLLRKSPPHMVSNNCFIEGGHPIIKMVDQHPSIETMVRTGTDGFQIPLPALVKLHIIIGCKGINPPL